MLESGKQIKTDSALNKLQFLARLMLQKVRLGYLKVLQ